MPALQLYSQAAHPRCATPGDTRLRPASQWARLCRPAAILLALLLPLHAEQLWLSQNLIAHAADDLTLGFFNTVYTEHGKHFANEEAMNFRYSFAPDWSAGAGITWGQDKLEKHWVRSGRPTENVSLDWCHDFGGWTVFNAQRFDLYFREKERDWPLYRNIGSVTAPPLPRLPWSPRPYVTQQIYFSGRECFTGMDRFCQFRWGAGMRMNPCGPFFLSVYWQYRDIERPDGEWDQFRVAGISATLSL